MSLVYEFMFYHASEVLAWYIGDTAHGRSAYAMRQPVTDASHLPQTKDYLIRIALAGAPSPPRMFNGRIARKYRPAFTRERSSPSAMGMPCPRSLVWGRLSVLPRFFTESESMPNSRISFLARKSRALPSGRN